MRPIEGRVGRCSSVLYAGWYMMGDAEGDGDVEMDLRAGDYKWRVVAVERQNGIRAGYIGEVGKVFRCSTSAQPCRKQRVQCFEKKSYNQR